MAVLSQQELLDDVRGEFKRRKFSAGLFLAIIDFFAFLKVPLLNATKFDDVLKQYPRQEKWASGANANTLVVSIDNSKVSSLRPFYNGVERTIRADYKRFDYPSCAPHATHAWGDYIRWLDSLAVLGENELQSLRTNVLEFVLQTLPSHEFDPLSLPVNPPIFATVLEDFSFTARKGEPTGASFQGAVFGFLRADNPHLQMEVDKVRTGSKRLQRVGDIDAWDGSRLAITAEVKQFDIEEREVPDLEGFANVVARRSAIGIVVALGFASGVRETLESAGLRSLDREDLLRIVRLWDPAKQRIAVSSMAYFFEHVEKNKNLVNRFSEFLRDIDRPHEVQQVIPDT